MHSVQSSMGEIEKYKPNASVDRYTTDSAVWGASRGKGKRQTYSTAVGDFYALKDRKDIYIKVSERLGTLFNKDIYIEWDSGNLKVFFQNKQSEISESYNSIYEASGLINLEVVGTQLIPVDGTTTTFNR